MADLLQWMTSVFLGKLILLAIIAIPVIAVLGALGAFGVKKKDSKLKSDDSDEKS